MKKNVIVNLQYEGTHYWDSCRSKDISFLKNEHRHIFYICCKKEISHNDREIEVISFKRMILAYLDDKFHHSFGDLSCESIAEDLTTMFGLSYCSVLEDNENGAEVYKK